MDKDSPNNPPVGSFSHKTPPPLSPIQPKQRFSIGWRFIPLRPLPLFTIVLLSLMGLVGWQLIEHGFNQISKLLPGLSPPRLTPGTVVLQLRNAADLTTAIYTGEVIIPISQDQLVASFVIGSTKLVYVAKGQVKAGIDLSQLTDGDVTIGIDKIQIRLPPAVILDSKIDLNQSKVFDHQRTLLGPDVGVNLQEIAQREALVRMEMAACEKGLLLQANERAQVVINQLLTQSSRLKVEVVPTPVTSTRCHLINPPLGNANDPHYGPWVESTP